MFEIGGIYDFTMIEGYDDQGKPHNDLLWPPRVWAGLPRARGDHATRLHSSSTSRLALLMLMTVAML